VAKLLLRQCTATAIGDACDTAAGATAAAGTEATAGVNSAAEAKAAAETSVACDVKAADATQSQHTRIIANAVVSEAKVPDAALHDAGAAQGAVRPATTASVLAAPLLVDAEALITTAALDAPSRTQAQTPQLIKLIRRELLLSNDVQHIDNEEQQNVADTKQRSPNSRAEELEFSAGGESAAAPDFRSVSALLEQAELEGRQQQQQQQQLIDAPSTLALPPFIPLVTPRDAAPAAAPSCTPFVFSTVHLKSPSQVRGSSAGEYA
jgi:hypothetical protein